MAITPDRAEELLEKHKTQKLFFPNKSPGRTSRPVKPIEVEVVVLDLLRSDRQLSAEHLGSVAQRGLAKGGATGFFQALREVLGDTDGTLIVEHNPLEHGNERAPHTLYLRASKLREIAGIGEERGGPGR